MKALARRSVLLLALPGLAAAPALAQARITVVRGDENYPPFEMLADGRHSGLHVELVEALAGQLGLQLQWQSLPWKRALRLVELGQADAITYITRTPEREAWALFHEDNVLSAAEVRFIALKEQAAGIVFDGDLARFLARRSPIVVRGFRFGSAAIDSLKKVEGNNMADLVRMLKDGYSDVAVVNWNDFSSAFRDKPEGAAVVALDPPIRSMRNFIAFSRAAQHEELARRFGQALVAYKKSAEYQALLRRYQVAR